MLHGLKVWIFVKGSVDNFGPCVVVWLPSPVMGTTIVSSILVHYTTTAAVFKIGGKPLVRQGKSEKALQLS